jgi:hypothetical protein
MKKKLILTAAIVIPFLHIMFFVWNTGSSTVFRDDMYLIKGSVVEKFCNRTLTFADLWQPTGASRILGYNLLLLANTAWCGLNSRLVVLLIPFVLLATAILLLKDYNRSLDGLCSPMRIAGTYALPMLLLFNLTLWEGLCFDYAIIFVWCVPWFLASFYALEDLLLKGSGSSCLLATIIPGLAVLVFGQSSSFAFITALAITFGCRIALDRQWMPKGFVFRGLAGAVVLGLIAFLYLYRIADNDHFPDTRYMDWNVFANLWNALRFVLAALAASVAGVDVLESHLSPNSIVALGSLVALVYVWALILYFKTRMHDRTYLPLFMIGYALSFVAFMTMGRFQYGLLYGMAARYTCSTLCGIIAIVWISLFVLAKPASATKLLRRSLSGVIALIFAGMFWTSVLEWRIQPYRHDSFKRLAEIAMRVDTASDEELAEFEEHPSLVRSSLRVLRKHQLNIYGAGPGLTPPASTTRLSLSAGSACITSTSSMTEAARIGYATLECDTAIGLSAAAVLRLVQNDVVISESAVHASHPTNAARILVDFRSGVAAMPAGRDAGFISINTGLALVSCGPAAARVTYTLRNRAGEILTTGHDTVAGGAHFATFVDQLRDRARDFDFPADFPAGTQMGSLDITADQPLSIAALRQTTNQRHEVISTMTPVADIAHPLNNLPAYFPQWIDGGGYATELHLLNTSSAIETGTFQIFDDSGAPMEVNQANFRADVLRRYSIPSGGIFHFQTDGSPPAARTGWVLLTPDVGSSTPVGAVMIRYSSRGILVTEYEVPAAVPATHARIYVDLFGSLSTALAIANIEKSEASISIKAFQMDGVTAAIKIPPPLRTGSSGHSMKSVGDLIHRLTARFGRILHIGSTSPMDSVTAAGNSPVPLRLRGSGHSIRSVGDLIHGLPARFRGILDISSTTPFVALALRSLKNERNDLLLTALPIADADRKADLPIIFPQIADGGGYTTELILINAGSQGTATFKFLGETGLPLAVLKESRAAGAR